jgi:pyruvate formate lyase activating enzyme
VWTEVTTLLIPGLNDSDEELTALTQWIAKDLTPDVPLHFSAFHPDYKMTDIPPTPRATLRRAREIGLREGLRYVYTGNVHDTDGDTTRCPSCDATVIVRDWYEILASDLRDGCCGRCGQPIAGRFDAAVGSFGRKRLRVAVAEKSRGAP